MKGADLDERLKNWIENNEKTIVYFPYASYAYNAYNGVKGFAETYTDHNKIGIYTGRQMDDISAEAFAETKRDTFEKFKSGEKTVMYGVIYVPSIIKD